MTGHTYVCTVDAHEVPEQPQLPERRQSQGTPAQRSKQHGGLPASLPGSVQLNPPLNEQTPVIGEQHPPPSVAFSSPPAHDPR